MRNPSKAFNDICRLIEINKYYAQDVTFIDIILNMEKLLKLYSTAVISHTWTSVYSDEMPRAQIYAIRKCYTPPGDRGSLGGQVYEAMLTRYTWGCYPGDLYAKCYCTSVLSTKIFVHYDGEVTFHKEYTSDYTQKLEGLALQSFLEGPYHDTPRPFDGYWQF